MCLKHSAFQQRRFAWWRRAFRPAAYARTIALATGNNEYSRMPDILQIAELVSRTSDIPPTIAGGFVTIGLDDVDDPDEILADEADDLTSALAG
ncbi:hypothetical protein [Azospirillum argentinense]|uniref:hypothetical protein n=1 Tax=Azospirillum argentinense TaxID=2970906 RepID=UPI0010BFFDED|nr:hypothetical protein [Azospirillum argentinense]